MIIRTIHGASREKKIVSASTSRVLLKGRDSNANFFLAKNDVLYSPARISSSHRRGQTPGSYAVRKGHHPSRAISWPAASQDRRTQQTRIVRVEKAWKRSSRSA
jgi:hypothetical protein